MIQRDAEVILRKLTAGFPAVSVMGPRLLGKKTLVRMAWNDTRPGRFTVTSYCYTTVEDDDLVSS